MPSCAFSQELTFSVLSVFIFCQVRKGCVSSFFVCLIAWSNILIIGTSTSLKQLNFPYFLVYKSSQSIFQPLFLKPKVEISIIILWYTTWVQNPDHFVVQSSSQKKIISIQWHAWERITSKISKMRCCTFEITVFSKGCENLVMFGSVLTQILKLLK